MSRKRIEDLGRLSVLLENILEHEIFREERMLPQDFENWFETQDHEKKQEILERIGRNIPEVEEMLLESLAIAKGIDCLNG